MEKALEHIKSKHNGEIPYRYGSNECAKLMADYAEVYHQDKLKSMVSLSNVSDLHECSCKKGDPVDVKICVICDGFLE